LDGYYCGFANEILWPLFHDLQTRCNFDPGYWAVYRKVNRKFANVVIHNTGKEDDIWVHDYHLIAVGQELRGMGVTAKIGYFLHIPFPPLDLFLKLPWRFQILDALLAYDLIGFQTQRDKRNFAQCVRAMFKHVPVRGKGRVVTTEVNQCEVRIGNFPISIDFDEFADKAKSAGVNQRAVEIQANLSTESNRRTLVLGVDRLDYTKGIPERLAAFGNALERFPQLREKISLVQIVVPSNPHDTEEVAASIAAACDMPLSEKRRRMKALRRKIQKSDIYWWVDSFVKAVFARDLKAFSPLEDHIPTEKGEASRKTESLLDEEAQPYINSLSTYRQLTPGDRKV
jgi:trehalose-6-phosphate synthase